MPIQALPMRFPRLRSALALSGLFMVGSAHAAQEQNSCETDFEPFGNYQMAMALYYPVTEGVSVDFVVNFERLSFAEEQPLHMHEESTRHVKALRASRLLYDIRMHYVDANEEFAVNVKEFSVSFPGPNHRIYDNELTSAEIHLGDERLSPERVNLYASSTYAKAYYSEAVANAVFERWVNGGEVRVQYFATNDNNETYPVGTIVLGADEIAQYQPLLGEQMSYLWALASEQECLPLRHRDASSDCFLTTASVHCLGLADNCWELQTLRNFRDRYLLVSSSGQAVVAEYYATAPAIVQRVNSEIDAQQRWLRTYWSGILPTAVLVRLGLHRAAQYWYSRMVRSL